MCFENVEVVSMTPSP